jgi:hypothetical protein
MHLRRKKPTEIPAEDLDRHSPNGEGSSDRGSIDTSMLGAIERLNIKRAIRKLPPGYKKLSLLHDVFGYEHNEIVCFWDVYRLFKIPASQGPKRLERLLPRRSVREAAIVRACEEIRPAQSFGRKPAVLTTRALTNDFDYEFPPRSRPTRPRNPNFCS